jgi:hypothetical protein
MTTIRSQNHKPWTQVREVKIAHRSLESVDTILKTAADRLNDFMTELGIADAGTIQLIVELDHLRKDLH